MKHLFLSYSFLRPASHLNLWLSLPLAFTLLSGHFLYPNAADGGGKGSSENPTNNYGKRYSNKILQGVKLSDVFTYNDTNTALDTPAYANV